MHIFSMQLVLFAALHSGQHIGFAVIMLHVYVAAVLTVKNRITAATYQIRYKCNKKLRYC